MSDELVKRWDEYVESMGSVMGEVEHMAQQMRDRIEQLTAERDGLLRCVTDNHVALCRAEKAEAERDRLREALDGLLTSVEHADFEDGWCCCGDDMLHHQSPMDSGHTPVDMGEYHAARAIEKARAALKGETP